MTSPVRTDVVVFGGGIAGLWTRAVLAKRGYSVLLLDHAPLGTGQTLASQGIIHAGIKYALSGKAGRASRMLASASAIWHDAMRGEGEIDLSELRVLTQSMYIWTRQEKSSKLAAWGASKAMRSGVQKVPIDERPSVFSEAPDAIDVYEVDEPVVDPAELLGLLHGAGVGACLRISRGQVPQVNQTDDDIELSVTDTNGIESTLLAQRVVLCAGVGNEALLGCMGEDSSLAQRRPLHMVVVRNAPVALFGHCVRLSDVPHLTITTSEAPSGLVWVVGGDLAERGVELSREELVTEAKRELASSLSWLNLSACEFDTFRVDRAEGRTADGGRPDEPVVIDRGGVIAAWPTKLVLAPIMADRVAAMMERDNVARTSGDEIAEPAPCEVANKPWEAGGGL